MKWIKALAISALVTAGASMLLLSAVSLVVCRSGVLPRGSLTLITTLSACLAVFLGGLVSGLSLRERGLFLGMGAGAVFLACALLVSAAVYGLRPEDLGAASIGKAAAVLLSGMTGGVAGANKKRKVRF